MNVRVAIFQGNYVAKTLGHVVFIPHLTHFWHMLIPQEYEFWIRQDLEWLKVCDAILRIEGESPGADREIELARSLGLKVYTSVFEIPKNED